MTPSILRTARLLPVFMFAGAIGFALPSSRAAAQVSQAGETAKDGPAASQPDSVGGVVVQAPRPESKLQDIPPDKKAAFDEEAAKAEAWKRYRKSTPSFGDSTLGLAKDYPGLQSLLPPPDEGPSVAPASVR